MKGCEFPLRTQETRKAFSKPASVPFRHAAGAESSILGFFDFAEALSQSDTIRGLTKVTKVGRAHLEEDLAHAPGLPASCEGCAELKYQ